MLCLSDLEYAEKGKRYYNQSLGVYISALEHCRNLKFGDGRGGEPSRAEPSRARLSRQDRTGQDNHC